MMDQAKKRLEELEKMRQDEIDARAAKQEEKKKLNSIQKEDQDIKLLEGVQRKKLHSSAAWENNHLLSYVFENKEHKALKYNKRNENIYNYYSGKLGVERA